jgi:hypothetical protein
VLKIKVHFESRIKLQIDSERVAVEFHKLMWVIWFLKFGHPQENVLVIANKKKEKKHKDWLIDYLRFYVPLKNFSLIWYWRCHHCRWRAAKFRPILSTQGLWAGRDLHRATPAVTRDLGFSGLIRRTAPFSHLLRHTRGCEGPILTRIKDLTDAYILYFTHSLTGIYSKPDPLGAKPKDKIVIRFHQSAVRKWNC